MRDLLNIIDSLAESRGLSAREPGAIYTRSGGTGGPEDQIVFQDLTFYPEVGAYNSTEEMMATLKSLEQKAGTQFHLINQPTARMLAFGVAKFDTYAGPRYLVKFAQDIKPVRTQNTFFQTKDIPGGFSQSDARGSKEKVGYKPSDVLTKFKNQTPESILEQIKQKFGDQSSEYAAAVTIASATDFPVTVEAGNMDFAGFRDYFCEMLQPIVLINGAKVKGNAAKAAELFMGKNGYSDCVVSFNENVSGGLYDSLLVNTEGKQIKLSSKGATGAMASSVNLLIAVQELERAGLTQFAKKYPEVIEVLEIIKKGNHDSGPLNLAVKYGLITEDEIPQVMSLKQYAGANDFNIDNVDISDNLKTLYKDRRAKDPKKIVPLNHLVSSIAYKVVNEINLKTNFSEAAADILNHSAFVQMYTDAAKTKDGKFIIQGFTTVWPSKLFTEVTLEAEKSYSSTSSSGGKLVFNINKEPKAVPNVDTSTSEVQTDTAGSTAAMTSKLDQVTDKRLTGPGARVAKSSATPKTDVGTLGREKRRD